jgi:hypothetical protein
MEHLSQIFKRKRAEFVILRSMYQNSVARSLLRPCHFGAMPAAQIVTEYSFNAQPQAPAPIFTQAGACGWALNELLATRPAPFTSLT